MKAYLRIAFAFVVIGGLALWFTPVDDRMMLLSSFAVVLALCVVIGTPAVRSAVAANARLTYGVGIAALLAALVVMFSSIAWRAISNDVSTTASVLLLSVGISALILPRTMKRYATDVAAAKRELALPKTGFDPIAEIQAVFADLAQSQPALIRIIGPWLILDLIALLPLAFAKDAAMHLDGDRAVGVKLFFGILGLVAVHLFLLWTALIKWVRFAASRDGMRLLDIPWKSLWGWAWRWIVYSTIFKSLAGVGPFLHRQLPAASPDQLAGLEAAIDFAAIVLFSPFCLAFIAVALGAADRSWFAAMRGFRVVGRKYFICAALILFPNALVTWALGAVDDHLASTGAWAVSLAIASIVTYSTMIVGATYCTRIYLRGEAAEGAGR